MSARCMTALAKLITPACLPAFAQGMWSEQDPRASDPQPSVGQAINANCRPTIYAAHVDRMNKETIAFVVKAGAGFGTYPAVFS